MPETWVDQICSRVQGDATMSSGNQGSPQNQGRRTGGAGKGARETGRDVGQRFQEGAQNVGQRVSEGYESARDEMGRSFRRAEGMMARNPTPSVLLGFGIGFGLGLVVTAMLAERESQSWSERHLPDRFRRMPDSLQSTLEQLTDTVRNLPDTLGRYMPDALSRR
jgi:hypothetical protein